VLINSGIAFGLFASCLRIPLKSLTFRRDSSKTEDGTVNAIDEGRSGIRQGLMLIRARNVRYSFRLTDRSD
jgi:hypothetical protein